MSTIPTTGVERLSLEVVAGLAGDVVGGRALDRDQ